VTPRPLSTPERWLSWFAVVFVLGHHTGTGLAPLGSVGPTRWADWVDLALPYALVGAAAMVLLRAGADRRAWAVLGVGALLYTQGHGIHLAANSVGNEVGHPSVVTLWDELVGHYLWYGGFAVVVLALVHALPDVRVSTTGWVLAGLAALTLSTNAVEGQTVVLSAVLALAFLTRARQPLARVTYGLHLLLLVGWVAYWAVAEGRWSPEFTELGWV
jgi:hypothetical protein